MSNLSHKDTINRIIDANINRTKEGLRVCEEITRFVLNNSALTSELKQLRHKIDAITKRLYPKTILLKERNSLADVGRNIYVNELKRKGLPDIFFANIQRVKESVRVLEEFTKLKSIRTAIGFKTVRYRIYEIEKRATKAIESLRNHR